MLKARLIEENLDDVNKVIEIIRSALANRYNRARGCSCHALSFDRYPFSGMY